MEKEYYIVVDDNRVGPLSLQQLAERGIEPSTLVWTAGMADWTRADCVPELDALLANRTQVDNQESAFGVYTQPENYGQRPYQQPQQQFGAYNNPHNRMNPMYNQAPSSVNWKTLSIVATVLGFLFSCIGGIIGIFGIVQASKAENAMRMGDEYTARSAWSTCKTLTIISFVLSGIGLIANIALISSGLDLMTLGLYGG